MAIIGLHHSHEQFAPSRLLQLSQRAETAGFQAGMCSDHFHPWSERQGESGFAWSWLGAALQATSWTFGMVCAPGQRYPPAILAQASATLSEMFPERLWCAFASGQFLNEHITGERWPTKAERNARLKEAVDVIRALWAGEEVTHRSPFFTVEEARLYSRPKVPPKIYGAALSVETARWLGSWADGLITVHDEPDKLRQLIDAFHEGGGEGKALSLQVHVAYAPSEQEALDAAYDQWRTNIFESKLLSDIKNVAQFDVLGDQVRREDVRQAVRVSSDLQQHLAWLQQDLELGFDHIYLHEAGPDQERFVDVFAEHVLPALK